MLPYILLYVLAFICAATDVFKTRNRIIVLIPFFVCMFLMVAFRNRLGGTDYNMYEMFYSRIVPLQDYLNGLYQPFYRTKSFEEGFIIFSSIVKTFDFTNGPFFYMFVIALVNFCIFYPSIREYTPFVLIAIFFFLYKAFFWHEFTLLRQLFAISLFTFSIRYVLRKQYLIYILINIIGFFFHSSAIILLPLCFFLNHKLSIRVILFVFAVATLISFFTPYLWNLVMNITSMFGISDRLSEYSLGKKVINPMNFIEIFIFLFIALFYRPFYESKEKYFNIFLNLFIFSSALIIAFSSFEIFARIKEYFVISYMVLISYFIGHISSNRTRLASFLILSVYIMLGYFRYIIIFDDGSLMPYSWILW